jgi:hypothetical protein
VFELACVALAIAPFSEGGALDELIARSARVQGFTAEYRVTTTADPAPTFVRIEYVAPDRARVDTVGPKTSSSFWAVGGTLVVRSQGEAPVHGEIDARALRATRADVERVLADGFGARTPAGGSASVIDMRWGYDAKAEKASYVIECSDVVGSETPFGWLTTLRAKAAAPREEEGRWVFDTDDGVFRVVVSKSTGFVEELVGKSPKGELRLALEKVAFDAVIDPARFEVPAEAGSGRDATLELRRAATRVVETALRRRIYAAIAGAEGPAWDEAQRAKVTAVLRAFHEHAIPDTLEPWLQRQEKIRDGVSDRLKRLAEGGKAPAEVEAVRQREIGYLKENLDSLLDGFLTRLSAPTDAGPLPRGDALLALEGEVVRQVFDARVRAPVQADFERATAAQR